MTKEEKKEAIQRFIDDSSHLISETTLKTNILKKKKRSTAKTNNISRLGMYRLNIPIEKTKTIIIMNKTM